MYYNLVISKRAVQDTKNSIYYYFVINAVLADRFNDELNNVYKKITTNPQFYKYLSSKKGKLYRCASLKSFPYIVIYRIKGNNIIVVSVFNTYKKPVYGQV